MAERRMFAKTIIDSDAFLDMPMSAQALYFHMAMRADDDGFLNNPKRVQRMVGASDDDCKLLLAKRFLIAFDSGVVVIKHWKIHNYIQSGRYKETVYQDEKRLLTEKKNKEYVLTLDEVDTECIQDGYNSDTQSSIDKNSIDKESIDNTPRKRGKRKNNTFVIPTVKDVEDYCREKGYQIDAEYFVNYYDGNGWTVKDKKMQSWRSTLATWEKRRKDREAKENPVGADGVPEGYARDRYGELMKLPVGRPLTAEECHRLGRSY